MALDPRPLFDSARRSSEIASSKLPFALCWHYCTVGRTHLKTLQVISKLAGEMKG
jgi:hypothetical protein